MYDKIELSKKSQEDLIAIAKGLNVKKPESISKEDLVYVILDEQAVQSKEMPPKKGRKKVIKDFCQAVTSYSEKAAENDVVSTLKITTKDKRTGMD